ncbi:IKK1 [Cordylochernes scorpioides]|uniref:IKK1 n=1 Tax=Cordylochernes scorpioides TaxID=51811 RepID=A0ABY6KHX2_9ARAC|nr:IKK1 [Cordylochernes scorpioides]
MHRNGLGRLTPQTVSRAYMTRRRNNTPISISPVPTADIIEGLGIVCPNCSALHFPWKLLYYGGCFLSNETIFERSRFARAGMLHTTLVPIDLESSGEFIFIRYHDFCNMGGERLTLQVEQTIRTLSKEGNSYSVIVKKLKAEGLDVGKATICRVVNGIGKKREAESNGQKFQVDRPRPVRTPATVSKVKRLATTENPPSQRQLSRMCGTSLKTINNIIHKDLELDTRRKGKVHKLTPFHMKNRATNARKLYEEHLAGSRSEYTATLDEAWMYVTYCNGIRKICYIKRGNQVPDNWVHQCSETFPKGFMVVGVMTGRGVLPLIKVPSKVKVNSEFYIECVLKPVIEQLKDLYPGEMDKVFLHHDKASSHTSNKTQQFLQEMKDTLGLNFIRNSDIPVKSPDASPLDFYGFGMLKQRLFNRRPKTEAGLWKAAQEEWSNVSLSKVKEVFAAWKVRCREIAKKKGKHIEHMKKFTFEK